ncbi:glycosyltransferase family 4 protein [Brevibacterium aurantiacum]|uniref:glycosyltransferase family 4 protein n=1 Tax=Brevibacterium aurantiacum TaxID=273384 RepID=UPI0013DDC196|nr:glycosyltransferase family 4 protein [Brevibacterium aurantiacum]
MKILLLSHYYWPEVGAPQRRWSTLVKHFIDQGHQVIVAAPHPHYPHSRRDEFFRSKVGRRRRRVEAKLGGSWDFGEFGERIIRVPYLHSGPTMTRQLLDQSVASLGAISAVMRLMNGFAVPDVIVSTTPALPYLFAGDAVARLLNVPHVAEVRDVWPDLISDLSVVTNTAGRYLPRTVTGFLEEKILPNLLTRAQRRASAVVVTTDSFRQCLQRRGINAEVVRSGVGRSEIDQTPHDKPSASDGVNLLYVGTVGRSQDLSSAVIAAARVPGVWLRIVGDGVDRPNLQALASSLGSPVEFFEQITGAELAQHWDWADAGLVSLGDVPAHARTVPSKLYSLLVRKIPILGIVSGEAADIITSNCAGLVAQPGNVDSVVTSMQALVQGIDSPDERGRQWVFENASVDVMGREYDRILELVSR